MHAIVFTDDAKRQLRQLSARNQRTLLRSIEEQLTHQPALPTRNLKPLRPNNLAEWELRVQQFRVFYNVEEEAPSVVVVAVAAKKGNKILIEGKEYKL